MLVISCYIYPFQDVWTMWTPRLVWEFNRSPPWILPSSRLLFQAAGNRLQLLHPKQFKGLANLQALWKTHGEPQWWEPVVSGYPATLTKKWLAGAYLIWMIVPAVNLTFLEVPACHVWVRKGISIRHHFSDHFECHYPTKTWQKREPPLIIDCTKTRGSKFWVFGSMAGVASASQQAGCDKLLSTAG